MATRFRSGAPGVPHPRGGERRWAGRTTAPFPTFVHGVSAAGHAFKLETVLENISGGGLYLLLPEAVAVGARLFLVVRFDQRGDAQAPRLALRASVVRSEPLASGACGVAVAFTRGRFL